VDGTTLSLSLVEVDAALAQVPAGVDWLSASEQARAAAMARPARRAQFLAGRWALRMLLSAVSGRPLSEWTIEADPHGPARVVNPPADVADVAGAAHVGIAHSGRFVLVGCAARPFGLDLEDPARRLSDPQGWLDFALTPAERARCMSMPAGELARALLQHWTAKEAFAKASGDGLPFDALRRIEALPAAGGANTWLGESASLTLAVHSSVTPFRTLWFEGAALARDLRPSAWRVARAG